MTALVNGAGIYLYYTADSSSAELYDCLVYQSIFYCRRPSNSIRLERDHRSPSFARCYHQGRSHSFLSLWQNNQTINEIFHQWNSALDKLEDFLYYQEHQQKTNADGNDQYLCECVNEQTFGKHCEYQLPIGSRFEQTVSAKFERTTGKLMYEGDIVCYRTLQCNSGLLCLDWRDICDGLQQCMYGYDEENCDKLEFNECEDDEYRCRNGMCIADEYFLDGDFDCMDKSDERDKFSDAECPYRVTNLHCDDALCYPDKWSCGDGQCVKSRLPWIRGSRGETNCANGRNEFFLCEAITEESLWTLPNGRCSRNKTVEKDDRDDYCQYLKVCSITFDKERDCPCRTDVINCDQLFKNHCSSWNVVVHYPNGPLLAPHMFGYYDQVFSSSSSRMLFAMNGTIKCHGYLLSFDFKTVASLSYDYLRTIESNLCARYGDEVIQLEGGYDPFCFNHSRTFNQRSYQSFVVCDDTAICISPYRISDQIVDCESGFDEWQDNQTATRACFNVRRHRFRCSPEQTTCLYPGSLSDNFVECRNGFDVFWLGKQIVISRLNCNSRSQTDCAILRQYIEASWHSNQSHLESLIKKKIPFRSHCDTFDDTSSKLKENSGRCQRWRCSPGQFQCYDGQCINSSWAIDWEWDCLDGSDEEGMWEVRHPNNPNYPWLNASNYILALQLVHPWISVWPTCDFKMVLSLGPTYSKYCINETELRRNASNCLTGCSEKEVIDHCFQSMLTLGYHCRLLSMHTCLKYGVLFHRCDDYSPLSYQCKKCTNGKNCESSDDFQCWNGTWIKERCRTSSECFHRENQYMCGRSDRPEKPDRYGRRTKEARFYEQEKKLQLPRYPSDVCLTEIFSSKLRSIPKQPKSNQNESFENRSILRKCNRGIGVRSWNDSIVCFCPPHYHGDQCQYHSDRLSLLLKTNYTYYSHDLANQNLHFINKYLVLLLNQNEIVNSHEYHLRPAEDMDKPTKTYISLSYSSSNESLVKKQERYFNRTNIIAEHPYSLRIEMYEVQKSTKPLRVAIWQYPIYFDYLPVYRLAKVLHFVDSQQQLIDPCSSNPCQANEECYQLQNEPRKYNCLCPPDHFGRQCTRRSELCAQNYCSKEAICRPEYRGQVKGNEWPYCICPWNRFGQHCRLILNACAEQPCQNNGTCYEGFLPSMYQCQCPDGYRGLNCEEQSTFVQFDVKKISTEMDYQGIVIQYLGLDFVDLSLHLIHQSIEHTIPSRIKTSFDNDDMPRIILLKLYSMTSAEFYLLSVQTMKVQMKFMTGNVSIAEENRCPDVRSLFSTDSEDLLYEYHSVCQNHSKLLCFYDRIYLCVCNEDHLGVECLNYNHDDDRCDRCLSGGKCLRGRTKRDFLCLCPSCHLGSRCQFNFESFSFTLDQLFFDHLLSNDQTIKNFTYYSLICFPCLLLLCGLISNICCFMTFRQSTCLRNGIGQYLLSMSVLNQWNLLFLLMRLVHLTMIISRPYSSPLLDTICCKLFNYLLLTTTHMIYWLSSFIAMERLYVVIFLNGKRWKHPSIARRIIVILTLTILFLNSYQLIFEHWEISSDDGLHSMCVMHFPADSQSWSSIHTAVTILHSLGPFTINLFCTTGIIYIVTQKKIKANAKSDGVPSATDAGTNDTGIAIIPISSSNSRRKDQSSGNLDGQQKGPLNSKSHFALLKSVIIENKEIILAPALTLVPQVFSLPFFIASFLLQCRNIHGNAFRYILIISYFTTFIPQLFTFHLYVSPSSFYFKHWQATKLAKKLMNVRESHSTTKSLMDRTTRTEGKTK